MENADGKPEARKRNGTTTTATHALGNERLETRLCSVPGMVYVQLRKLDSKTENYQENNEEH